MPRVDWKRVPASVRAAVQQFTGPVITARTTSAGLNSEIAVILEAATGRVFVKGRPVGRNALTQRRETAINPYVLPFAPRLLWRVVSGGWDVLGFEYVAGRHANYTPRSADLDRVVALLRQLGSRRCPDLPEVKLAEQRWSDYLDDLGTAELFAGETLLHTDFNPLNLLVHGEQVRLIDWAWPTRGAAFIDPACWIVRLIAAGHTPYSAEEWARRCPAYAAVSDHVIGLFATATDRMWQEIARQDPAPWKLTMARSAREWLDFTRATRRVPANSVI